MSLSLNLYVISDLSISYLEKDTDKFDYFIYGEAPEGFEKPDFWPGDEIDGISTQFNVKGCDLYHFILNGTEEPVREAGGIFQVFSQVSDTDIRIVSKYNQSNEAFAFDNNATKKLADLLTKLDDEIIEKRLTDWIKKYPEGWEYQSGIDYELDMLKANIPAVREFVTKVSQDNLGIAWCYT